MNKYLKRYYLRIAVIVLGILISIGIALSGYAPEIIWASIAIITFFVMLGFIVYCMYWIIKDTWVEISCRKVLKTDEEFEWYKQYSWHIFSADPCDRWWLGSDERTPEELELIKRLCEATRIDCNELMEEAND